MITVVVVSGNNVVRDRDELGEEDQEKVAENGYVPNFVEQNGRVRIQIESGEKCFTEEACRMLFPAILEHEDYTVQVRDFLDQLTEAHPRLCPVSLQPELQVTGRQLLVVISEGIELEPTDDLFGHIRVSQTLTDLDGLGKLFSHIAKKFWRSTWTDVLQPQNRPPRNRQHTKLSYLKGLYWLLPPYTTEGLVNGVLVINNL